MAASLFGLGAVLNLQANGSLVPQSFTGTEGQTVFNLTAFTYQLGSNSLQIWINGQRQQLGRDFTETSTTSFTLVEAVHAGDFVDVVGFLQTNVLYDATALKGQLADGTTIGLGDSLLGVKIAQTGAVVTTQDQVNNDSILNAFRFMTAAQIADIQARTTTLDVSGPLNVAIVAALLSRRALYLPSGNYRIDSPLFVYTAATYITLQFIGEIGSMLSNGGTVIDHSRILTAPGMCVQGARKVSVEGIAFWGPCTSFDAIANFFLASEWVQGGVRDSQYSPQCAIAVDPFANGVPADGGYPTLAAYYTGAALASSQVDVKNCYFRHQIVGVAYSPQGLAANDENGYMENCDFSACKTPIALCEIQSKGMSFNGIYADLAYTVIDTYSYGTRNGSTGFQWTGGDVSRSCAIIRTISQVGAANSITQNWSIRGCYFESIWTIGWIGTFNTYNQLPGHFDTCTFWFNGNDAAPMKDAHLVNFAPLKFTSCVFHANHSVVLPSITRILKMFHSGPGILQTPPLVFECCVFQGVESILFNLAALQYVRMNSCTGYSPYFKYNFSEVYKLTNMNDITNDNGMWPGSLVLDANTGDILQVAQGMNSYSLGAITVSLTGGASTATFTAPDANTFRAPATGFGDVVYVASHNIEGIDGGLIAASNWPLGFCITVAGTAITLAGVSKNAPSGAQTLSLNWYAKLHGPTTVSTTNTSTAFTITQTGSAGAWQVNQRIISANIPGGAYIISGTSPNFVLSKAATATAAGTRAYDANANTITKAAY